MAQEFNTSFIPKKEVQSKKRRTRHPGANIFLLIGVIMFLSSLLAYLGVFLWSSQLDSANNRALQTLEKNRESYGIEAIQEFLDLNYRLEAADLVLEKHTLFTPIFEILEDSTLTDVYLSNFSLKTESENVLVQARGYAPTYAHVALQADEYGSNNLIRDLILSGVNQSRNGGVQFDLTFTTAKPFID